MVKKIGIVAAVLVAGFVLFCGWYRWYYAMDVIAPVEMNDPGAATRVLIGSQGSNYKNSLVAVLLEQLAVREVYVKVVDVTMLPGVSETEWDAIVLISTIEYYAAQEDVESFIAGAAEPDKIVLLTTSGQGDMPPKECRVDAITTASESGNVVAKAATILARLDEILGRAGTMTSRIHLTLPVNSDMVAVRTEENSPKTAR